MKKSKATESVKKKILSGTNIIMSESNIKAFLSLLLIAVCFSLVSCASKPVKEAVELTIDFPEETKGIVWFAANTIQSNEGTVSIGLGEQDGIIILQKDGKESEPYIIEHVTAGKTVQVELEDGVKYKVGLVNDGSQSCTFEIENASISEGANQNAVMQGTLIAEYKAKRELIPSANFFIPYTGELWASEDGKAEVVSVYIAEDGSGMTVEVNTKSFGGTLTEILGINKNGEIVGVKIMSHADTPGVGTEAMNESHLSQYVGVTSLSSTSIESEQNIDSVSGATVSSNGIHYGIYAALQQYSMIGE